MLIAQVVARGFREPVQIIAHTVVGSDRARFGQRHGRIAINERLAPLAGVAHENDERQQRVGRARRRRKMDRAQALAARRREGVEPCLDSGRVGAAEAQPLPHVFV